MAAILGLYEDVEEYENFRSELIGIINANLWSEKNGFYYDVNFGRDSGFIKVASIASILPLVAGIPTPEMASKIISKIIDPRVFGTAIPFPSVARNDPSFEKDCWRGPVWMNMAYLILWGLKRYGYHSVATELALRLVHGIFGTWNDTGKFFEFYDPDSLGISELTRKKGSLWKLLTLGNRPVADFIGWTGLVNNVIVEVILGIGGKDTVFNTDQGLIGGVGSVIYIPSKTV
jgi:neutral trehalase